MLQVVLSESVTTPPLWLWALLLLLPISILVALLGFGLRGSVPATKHASAVGAGAALAVGLALELAPETPDPLLAGLLFVPAFALVYWHERDRGRAAEVVRRRPAHLLVLGACAVGLLVSGFWFLLAFVAALPDGTPGGPDPVDLALFFGYGGTGIVVCGYVGYRILRDARRRVVSGRAANVR